MKAPGVPSPVLIGVAPLVGGPAHPHPTLDPDQLAAVRLAPQFL